MQVALPRTLCRVCNGTSARTAMTGSEDRFGLGGTFSVMRCASCGFLWTSLPEGFDLEAWYERGYWQTESSRSAGGKSNQARALWRAWNGSARPSRWVKTGRVLDLGCGPAYDSADMLAEGAEPIGVDSSRSALGTAMKNGVPGILASAERLPLREASFDTVVMSQVLEHMSEPEKVLQEVLRVLRPGGSILVLLPNANSVERWLFGRHWVNWHLPFHLWHFNPRTLRALLERTGVEVTHSTSVSPGEWFLLSASKRWPLVSRVSERRHFSLVARALIAPLLRLADFVGAGNCIVLQARKSVVPAAANSDQAPSLRTAGARND